MCININVNIISMLVDYINMLNRRNVNDFSPNSPAPARPPFPLLLSTDRRLPRAKPLTQNMTAEPRSVHAPVLLAVGADCR